MSRRLKAHLTLRLAACALSVAGASGQCLVEVPLPFDTLATQPFAHGFPTTMDVSGDRAVAMEIRAANPLVSRVHVAERVGTQWRIRPGHRDEFTGGTPTSEPVASRDFFVVGQQHAGTSTTWTGVVKVYNWDSGDGYALRPNPQLGSPETEFGQALDSDGWQIAVADRRSGIAIFEGGASGWSHTRWLDNPAYPSAIMDLRIQDDLLAFSVGYTVWIYRFDGSDWVQEGALQKPNNGCQRFGQSVEILGSRIVVSDPTALSSPDPSAGCLGDSGEIYVYEQIAGLWTETQTLDLGGRDYLGWDMQSAGDRLVANIGSVIGVQYALCSGNPLTLETFYAAPSASGGSFGNGFALGQADLLLGSRALEGGLWSDTFGVCEIGATSCSANLNSTGAAANLRSFGSADVSANSLTLRVHGAPASVPGLLLAALLHQD